MWPLFSAPRIKDPEYALSKLDHDGPETTLKPGRIIKFQCKECSKVFHRDRLRDHCKGQCRDSWYYICVECKEEYNGWNYMKHTECLTERRGKK